MAGPKAKRVHVRVATCEGCALHPKGLHVDLPTYNLVEQHEDGTWTVAVPPDYCDEEGHLDAERIRVKYRENPMWDFDELTVPSQDGRAWAPGPVRAGTPLPASEDA